MISFKTLLFPDTTISKDKLYPLFLFCSPLHFLQLVEADPEDNQQSDTDIFTEQGLCQGHTPVPLGKDRDRFLHLVRDIRERKDDYAAQLSALTMAAMSAPQAPRREEKRTEIISSLLAGHSLSQPTSPEELELWQARLVLAIAEMLEEDEEVLQQQLNLLDSRELEMFRTLQGNDGTDEDDPFVELEQIRAQMETRRPEDEKKRFNSWVRLMATFPLPPDIFWLASSPDSGDQIINRFDKEKNRSAMPIFRLTLPAKISVSTNYLVQQIKDFHQAAHRVHQKITNDLIELAQVDDYDPASVDLLLPATGDWSGQWDAILDNHFPASNHGRSELTIYLLPDRPIADLLKLQQTTHVPGSFKHGLLGIFRN